MSKIWVGTTITADRLEAAKPYFKSLYLHSAGIHPFVITMGFNCPWLRGYYPGIKVWSMPLDWMQAVDSGFYCPQYGCFLPAMRDLADDDIVILTDSSDLVLQRPLTKDERLRFYQYDNNTVGLGYNAGPGDNAAAEFDRIVPNPGAKSELELLVGPLANILIYNCGVIVTRPQMFRRWWELYEQMWPSYAPLFEGYSKTQLLLNACLHKLGVRIDTLGYEIHSNGHYPLHPGHRGDSARRLLYWHDRLVLFKHRVDGQFELDEYNRLERIHGTAVGG